MRLKPALLLMMGVLFSVTWALVAALLRDAHPALAQLVSWVALLSALLLIILAAIDAYAQRSVACASITRQLPEQFVQGQTYDIELIFTPPSAPFWQRPRTVQVADWHPPQWQTATPLLNLTTLPGRSSHVHYRVTPLKRGEAEFGGIEYWLPSALGLWQRRYTQAHITKVKVLPDFSRILGAELVSMQRWLNWVGVKKLPRQGQGQDFHQLRDYQQGDDIRFVDWKASARLNKPIVRSFQQEQDQQVIFLLNCGRNMRLSMDHRSHFDHSLQAMLLLAFTALKHNDAVGLLTFAHPTLRFVPPHKGLGQLGRLVGGVYDIEPSLQAGDLDLAVTQLLSKQRRRALVVVLTHMDYEDSDAIRLSLLRLKKHHRVLVAGLQPQAPEALLSKRIENHNDVAGYLGAHQYRQQAAHIIRQLEADGIYAIHALPDQLSSSLINRYLKLKRTSTW